MTGHEAHQYDAMAANWAGFCTTVHNPRFAESGSMYSLYCAREALDEPFLLLESDLVYESRALEQIMAHPSEDAILLSGPTGAGDEVFVQTREGQLVAMSKDRADLGAEVAGELVGISKISAELLDVMLGLSRAAFESSLHYDYETDCLVAAGAQRPIACPLVADLLWGEIDDPSHLLRVQQQVYPRLDRVESPPR